MPSLSDDKLNDICLQKHGFSLRRTIFYSSVSHQYYGMQITQVDSNKAPIGVRVGNYITGVNDIVFDESSRTQAVLNRINRMSASDIKLSISTEADMLLFNTPFYIQRSLARNGFFAVVDQTIKRVFISHGNPNHSLLCSKLMPGDEILKINDILISGIDNLLCLIYEI